MFSTFSRGFLLTLFYGIIFPKRFAKQSFQVGVAEKALISDSGDEFSSPDCATTDRATSEK